MARKPIPARVNEDKDKLVQLSDNQCNPTLARPEEFQVVRQRAVEAVPNGNENLSDVAGGFHADYDKASTDKGKSPFQHRGWPNPHRKTSVTESGKGRLSPRK